MAQYFSDPSGNFVFPDEIFPDFLGSSSVPDSPVARAQALRSEHRLLKLSKATDPETQLKESTYVWARNLLQVAELYGCFDAPTIADAKEIISRVAEARNSGVGRYRGQACYIKGNWSLFGLFGVPIDALISRDLYKLAIQHGCARGWYRMGANAEARDDVRTALLRYETGAKLGDIACIYRLAMASMLGHLGVSRDPQRALRMFEQACDGCDADFPQPAYLLGQLMLGEMDSLLSSEVPPAYRDRARGITLLEKAARLGFSPAILRMAAVYQSDDRGPNFMVALRYLHLAARQDRFAVHIGGQAALRGEPESQLVKWLLVGHPPVIEKNEDWAFRFAAAGAELLNSTAQFAMGYMAEVGIACVSDRERAIEHYRKSSQNGCVAAAERLESLAQESVTRIQQQQHQPQQQLQQQPQQQQQVQMTGPHIQNSTRVSSASSQSSSGLRRTLTRQDHDRTLRLHAQRLAGPRLSLTEVRMITELESESTEDLAESANVLTAAPTMAPSLSTQAAPVHSAPYPVSPEQPINPMSFTDSVVSLPYPTDDLVSPSIGSPYANSDKSLPSSPSTKFPPSRKAAVVRKPAPGQGRSVSSPVLSGSTPGSAGSSISSLNNRRVNGTAGPQAPYLASMYQEKRVGEDLDLSQLNSNFEQNLSLQHPQMKPNANGNSPPHQQNAGYQPNFNSYPRPSSPGQQPSGLYGPRPISSSRPSQPRPPSPGKRLFSVPESGSNYGPTNAHNSINGPASILDPAKNKTYTSNPRNFGPSNGTMSSSIIASTNRQLPAGRNVRAPSAPVGSPGPRNSIASSISDHRSSSVSAQHSATPILLSESPGVSPTASSSSLSSGLDKPRVPGVAYSFEEMGVKTVASDDGKCIIM